MMTSDLEFIAGSFADYQLPAGSRYLLKYFTTAVQVAFLRYYLVFGESKNFTDHTGHYCSKSLLQRLERRFNHLTTAHSEAKLSLTEESLAKLQLIESGKYPLTALADL